MPPRKRQNFTQQDIDAQLQSIHLLDSTSATENLEALGPIIKTITENRQQESFLRTINDLIQSKDDEIQKICSDNYQDFVSSVSTLLTVRSYTVTLKDRVGSLDESVTSVGRNLALKKKELLHNKKTGANLDEAIDTLQACLRILDVVKRTRDMIKEGRHWSALRLIEEIQALPPSPSLAQTPLYTHLISSLPSLRVQIKDAVTASLRTCLLEIRVASHDVGKLALEAMRQRARRWRSRKEKEPALRNLRVGSAVELVTNERVEVNLLDNETVKLNFTPLYQSIHIYTALSILPTLRTSYHNDRKEQASLILNDNSNTNLNLNSSSNSNSNNTSSLHTSLPSLTASLLGFFVVETEVLRNTAGISLSKGSRLGFRERRQVDELWEDVEGQLVERLENGLRYERDGKVVGEIKDVLLPFVQTVESYEFDTTRLQAILTTMFDKNCAFLPAEFAAEFKAVVNEDDYQPMLVTSPQERDKILATCWMPSETATNLARQPLPLVLPFSSVFFGACTEIRVFVERFYHFTDGGPHYFKNVDSALHITLDRLLADHLVANVNTRIASTTTLFQAAQIITNVEHFLVALPELEGQLGKLRTSRASNKISLALTTTFFQQTLRRASDRIFYFIKTKLDDFFDLAEYDWTPPPPPVANNQIRERERDRGSMRPSMYLEEMFHWLMTVVDSLPLDERYKDGAFKAALDHVAGSLMEFLTGRNVPMINESGIANVLVDVDFLDAEFKAMGKTGLSPAFAEIRATTSLVLDNQIQSYLQPAARRSQYSMVNPRHLASLLDKLVKYGASSRNPAEKEVAERRRRDHDAIVRLF